MTFLVERHCEALIEAESPEQADVLARDIDCWDVFETKVTEVPKDL